jgi:5-methylcytosine-specific restriction endonuclease McrA
VTRRDWMLRRVVLQFDRNDPGCPLYPVLMGGDLPGRGNEKERWKRLLRHDPCSYCGQRAGTVDHIVAKAFRVARRSRWLDFTGACKRCNQAKGKTSLLFFLLERAA